jgi:hypothetical protein
MISCSFYTTIYQINSHNYAQVITILERSMECLPEDLHHHLVHLHIWPQLLWGQEEEEDADANKIGFVWNSCCKSSLDYCNANLPEVQSIWLSELKASANSMVDSS